MAERIDSPKVPKCQIDTLNDTLDDTLAESVLEVGKEVENPDTVFEKRTEKEGTGRHLPMSEFPYFTGNMALIKQAGSPQRTSAIIPKVKETIIFTSKGKKRWYYEY